jgi:DNA-binding CsgD family transcriptional regulator
MARTLFFIEALAFAALGFSGIFAAADLRAAFIAPFVLSLVVPLACALSVWNLREIRLALARVFAAPGTASGSGESVLVLEALSAFCGRAAVAGLAFSLAAALPRLLEGRPAEEWGLLGAYLALYSLLNAVASGAMAKVAARPFATEARRGPEPEARPAPSYGLTPREAEAASLIAGGASYKEASSSLGISIKTVKTHLAHVYEKTGCASNVALSLLLRKAEDGAGPPEAVPSAGAPPHTNGR